MAQDSRAAIKIYEMCCPLSNERVCAIKAKPPVVVSTIKLVLEILSENPIKGTIKPYDALHFDLGLIDKYGGYLPDEPGPMEPGLPAFAMGQQHPVGPQSQSLPPLQPLAPPPPSALQGGHLEPPAGLHQRAHLAAAAAAAQHHRQQHYHHHPHPHEQAALVSYTRQLREDMYSAAMAAASAAAAAAAAATSPSGQSE